MIKYSFMRKTILGWRRKVGFLPMNRSALNNPKVRYELREGSVPKEASKKLELLEEGYRRGRG